MSVPFYAGESSLGNRVSADCLANHERRRTGFTLIELLVVIGIIGVIAALVIPALARAKAYAISTACKSNLHQIGIGLNLYVDDYRRYPDWFTPVGRQNPWALTAIGWDTRLLPYLSSNCSVFICKARKSSALWTNVLHFNPSYAYNICGTGNGNLPLGLQTCPTSTVLSPAEMIAIGDYSGDDSPLNQSGMETADGDLAFDDAQDYVGDRHNRGGNVVFCDAHVEYGTQTNWMRPTDTVRARWNNDHQPHRETW